MQYYFQNRHMQYSNSKSYALSRKRNQHFSLLRCEASSYKNNINIICMLIHWLKLCTHGKDIDTLIKPLKGAKRVLQCKQQNHASNVDVDMAILNKMTNSK